MIFRPAKSFDIASVFGWLFERALEQPPERRRAAGDDGASELVGCAGDIDQERARLACQRRAAPAIAGLITDVEYAQRRQQLISEV